MKFNRKRSSANSHSRLSLRLWDFTGTALLNLFMFLFLIAYLSPPGLYGDRLSHAKESIPGCQCAHSALHAHEVQL